MIDTTKNRSNFGGLVPQVQAYVNAEKPAFVAKERAVDNFSFQTPTVARGCSPYPGLLIGGGALLMIAASACAVPALSGLLGIKVLCCAKCGVAAGSAAAKCGTVAAAAAKCGAAGVLGGAVRVAEATGVAGAAAGTAAGAVAGASGSIGAAGAGAVGSAGAAGAGAAGAGAVGAGAAGAGAAGAGAVGAGAAGAGAAGAGAAGAGAAGAGAAGMATAKQAGIVFAGLVLERHAAGLVEGAYKRCSDGTNRFERAGSSRRPHPYAKDIFNWIYSRGFCDGHGRGKLLKASDLSELLEMPFDLQEQELKKIAACLNRVREKEASSDGFDHAHLLFACTAVFDALLL